MYIDIEENDNVSEATMATFKETGMPERVSAVKLLLEGSWQWCAISGWSHAGASSAFCSTIEESGDGPARLVHGGDQGLRLTRITDPAQATLVQWSLTTSEQWGEPFLLCRPETDIAFIAG